MVAEARALGVDLVAFPELTLTGYPPEDLLFKSDFIEANLRALDAVVRAAAGLTVVVGFVDRRDDIYNTAALVHDRAIATSTSGARPRLASSSPPRVRPRLAASDRQPLPASIAGGAPASAGRLHLFPAGKGPARGVSQRVGGGSGGSPRATIQGIAISA